MKTEAAILAEPRCPRVKRFFLFVGLCVVAPNGHRGACQSQNLTHWRVLYGPESSTYQPRAKSIPRAEKRP
jgi:hypothetical protein